MEVKEKGDPDACYNLAQNYEPASQIVLSLSENTQIEQVSEYLVCTDQGCYEFQNGEENENNDTLYIQAVRDSHCCVFRQIIGSGGWRNTGRNHVMHTCFPKLKHVCLHTGMLCSIMF